MPTPVLHLHPPGLHSSVHNNIIITVEKSVPEPVSGNALIIGITTTSQHNNGCLDQVTVANNIVPDSM